MRYYGGTGTETTVDLDYISNSDQYLILSNSTSRDNIEEPTGLTDIHLIKTSNDGSIVTEAYLDFTEGSNLSDDIASSMRVFNDTIYLAGTVQIRENELGAFTNKAGYYALLDLDFNVLHSDTIAFNGIDVEANDITRTSDGDLVLLMTLGDALTSERDLMYAKFSSTGALRWLRFNPLPGDDVGVSIIELNNQNLAVCAKTDRISVKGFGGANVLYLVLNPRGFISNSLSYGTTSSTTNNIDDIPTKMVKDGNGAMIVGSSSANDLEEPFFLPLTSTAAIDSIREVTIEGQEAGGARFNDFTRALNGEFLVTGEFLNYTNTSEELSLDQGEKRQETLFLRTDQFGTSNLSVNHFGDNFDDFGNAIYQLPDGKILIGATISFGGANSKIGLFKVNRSGELLE
ncbi:MAG: hypothetical protein AAFO69_20210 [Bacteroidota bacterium]